MNEELKQRIEEIVDMTDKTGDKVVVLAEISGGLMVAACVKELPETSLMHLVGTLVRGYDEKGFNPREVIARLIRFYPQDVAKFVDEVSVVDSLINNIHHGAVQ